MANEKKKPMNLTAVYEKDEGGSWLAHIAEDAGCHVYARTLKDARKRILDAAEFWFRARIAPDAIVDRVVFPQKAERLAAERHAALKASAQVSELNSKLVALLQDQDWSTRDIGFTLDLTPQRISQIARDTR